MKYNTLHTFIFSPTGTSRKIAQATAQGMNIAEVRQTDLTWQAAPQIQLSASEVALFAVPVYGGKVAPAALKRIEAIRGEGTPAVLITLYGNRSFGNAPEELALAVRARGFIPVAVGAFVGEHSYSTRSYPIAAGRPTMEDLQQASAFGHATAMHLATTDHPVGVETSRIKQPASGVLSILRFIYFAIGYRRSQKRQPIVQIPSTDPARCTHCSRCASCCPTGAITAGDELRTTPERCIRCCACVKECPMDARSYESPFAATLARNFAHPKQNVYFPR